MNGKSQGQLLSTIIAEAERGKRNVIAVESADAVATAKELVKTEGLLVGISSGAALWAATRLAALGQNAGKNIAVIFPDGGERYLRLSPKPSAASATAR